MAKFASPIVQVAVAVIAALALSLLLQCEFAQGHHAVREAIGIATFPAILLAFVIGGHEASGPEYTIGIVLQFLVMLWLGRLMSAAYSKLKSSMA